MRTLNFTLLAVLGCIAMIGAIPTTTTTDPYVPSSWQQLMEIMTLMKVLSPARARPLPTILDAGSNIRFIAVRDLSSNAKLV
jgi:hypothetical protein